MDRILAGTHQEARTPLPPEVLEWTDPRMLRDMSPEERKAFQRDLRRRSLALKGWWLDEMVTTDSPLTERMTLFWHNHFTSSIQKVRSPALMARQNALLRRYALGNFGALLHAVAKDPAMLVWLDGRFNTRQKPQENFGRELMELFSMGVGFYTESDVYAAAKVFTGWNLTRTTASAYFVGKLSGSSIVTWTSVTRCVIGSTAIRWTRRIPSVGIPRCRQKPST